MSRVLTCLLATIATVSVACQFAMAQQAGETRQVYLSRVALAEEESKPLVPVILTVIDKRLGQESDFDLSYLKPALVDSLEMRGFVVNEAEGSSKITAVDFKIEVSFFGTYKSLTGKLGLKAVCALDSKGTEHVPITFDTLLKKKKLKAGEWQEAESYLVTELSKRILERMAEVLKRESTPYRRVTAAGCAPVKADADKTLPGFVSAAVLDALRNVCEKAWGMRVESTTELTDIVDVKDWVKRHYGCTILEYEVLKEFSAVTSDGFDCVVVKAITVKD